MADKKLSDADAKRILLRWPTQIKEVWPPPGGNGAWIRAQPIGDDDKAPGPRIIAPGSKLFYTQPDGLWVHFNGVESCDVIAVESCGTSQNLNDKRARYMPSTHSLVLSVTRRWVEEEVSGGRGPGSSSRRELAGTMPDSVENLFNVPIRNIRVLYALPNELYVKWVPEHPPSGSEFFIPHSSLDTYNAPDTQTFLRGMSVATQFRSLPQNVRL
jgi:hypothetical protein